MEKAYYKDKARGKKSAMKGVWVVVVLGIIFTIVMIKFATSGGISDVISFSKMPNADDAYKVAKDYIRPTIKAGNITFPDKRYQFGKNSDSVFVIKSYAVGVDAKGEKSQTSFEIILKYEGGPKQEKQSWAIVDVNESDY